MVIFLPKILMFGTYVFATHCLNGFLLHIYGVKSFNLWTAMVSMTYDDEKKHIVTKRTIYGQSKWLLKPIILDVHH